MNDISEPVHVYVRCCDGALYKDPLLVLPHGFAQFSGCAIGCAEIVEWVADAFAPPARPESLAARLLGRCVFWGEFRKAERVVPYTKPFEYRPAHIFTVTCTQRIPRPTTHSGTQRYAGRCEPDARVFEFPKDVDDAKRIRLK